MVVGPDRLRAACTMEMQGVEIHRRGGQGRRERHSRQQRGSGERPPAMGVLLGAAVLGCMLDPGRGNMYDVIADWKLPPDTCRNGCDRWVNHSRSWWANVSNAVGAGNACAQLAYAPGLSDPTGPTGYLDPTGHGGNGAWCFCADAVAPPVPAALRQCAAAVQQDCGGHLHNLTDCRDCKEGVPGAWAKLEPACGARPISNFHASCEALFPGPVIARLGGGWYLVRVW